MCDWPWHFYLTWLHRSVGLGKQVQCFFIKLFFLKPFLIGLRNNTEKPYVLSAWFPTCPMLWTNRTVSLDDVDINAWKIKTFPSLGSPILPFDTQNNSPFPLATWVTTGNHYVLLIFLGPSFWERNVDGITWYVILGGMPFLGKSLRCSEVSVVHSLWLLRSVPLYEVTYHVHWNVQVLQWTGFGLLAVFLATVYKAPEIPIYVFLHERKISHLWAQRAGM